MDQEAQVSYAQRFALFEPTDFAIVLTELEQYSGNVLNHLVMSDAAFTTPPLKQTPFLRLRAILNNVSRLIPVSMSLGMP